MSKVLEEPMRKWRPEKEGDVHPKCGQPVVRKPGMFYFRGWSGDGFVCGCSLWLIPGEKNIFDVAKAAQEEGR